MKKAIAMKCTQEQFDAVKGNLEGINIRSITSFERYPWVINFEKKGIVNINKGSTWSNYWAQNPEIHETWNEKIFLEACGIETETDYMITKEQLQTIEADGCTYVKEWFPEAFEKELVVGKWYKYFGNLCVYNYGKDTYGWWIGEWSDRISFSKFETTDDDITEATNQEVETALIAEAKKRGFIGKRISLIEGLTGSMSCNLNGFYSYESDKNRLIVDLNGAVYTVFKDGTWAQIIPTITKAEAEKRLGVKIE